MQVPRPDSIRVKLNAGPVAVEGNWTLDQKERQAAWELYVELITRISVMKLPPDEGVLREALSSLHSLFGTTRSILREYGPEIARNKPEDNVSFGFLAVVVLNYVLRPFLTHWHPRLLDHEASRPADRSAFEHEKSWEHNEACRAALERVRLYLIAYADLLADVANVARLRMDTSLTTHTDADPLILQGDTLPYEK